MQLDSHELKYAVLKMNSSNLNQPVSHVSATKTLIPTNLRLISIF